MRYIFLLVLISGFFISNAQVNADSVWLLNNYTKTETMVPMRDGIKLFTVIYAPKDTTSKHPIMFRRTPYSCAPYGANNFNQMLYSSYGKKYTSNNYIIVFEDVRGKFMSEGEFVDVRPYNEKKIGKEIDEATDSYDAIDWLVKNVPGNNNKVGVWGVSYPGFYSTMAALSNHPSLKAVSPQAPVTDWFEGDDFHHNGAFFLMDAFSFYSGFGKIRPTPTTKAAKGFTFTNPNRYEFFLQTGALKNFTQLIGDSVPFWKELMQHGTNDVWWKNRNTRNFVQHIKQPAMLVVGGLFDAEDCFGAWSLYKAIETKSKVNNKIVMGPWFHGQWGGRGDGSSLGAVQFGSKTAEYYQDNIELPFFNKYLLGTENEREIAEATVFFTGENNWKTFNNWPPKNTNATAFYLHGNSGLNNSNKAIGPKFTQYVSKTNDPVPYSENLNTGRTREYMIDDQRFAGKRKDVVSFSTATLNDDVTIAGPILADLIVSLSTTDADFVVKIIDVYPDDFTYEDAKAGGKNLGGYQMLVRGEVLRGKFRNDLAKPIPFAPNKPTSIKFTLPDVAHTFKKGHKIMVQIQSSWFPLVDRNPQQFVDIYNCSNKDFMDATIKILHDDRYKSAVILPILNTKN
jgi:uncharacterized protein